MSNALVTTNVMHARHAPRKHAFHYGVYYLCFNLEERPQLKRPFLSLNKFNLFGFNVADHGPRDGTPLVPWIQKLLKDFNVHEANGPISLMTMPRILGHVFNPVSFWFCRDTKGNLRAVLAEVSNTFGEHHNYLCFHDDRRTIMPDDWLTSRKVFHVSPFMDVEGHYEFRFIYKADKIGVWINHYQHNTHMLSTSVVGTRQPLTSQNLLRCFVRYPLLTFKVVALIHFEALRLLFKGISFRSKPKPPTKETTR